MCTAQHRCSPVPTAFAYPSIQFSFGEFCHILEQIQRLPGYVIKTIYLNLLKQLTTLNGWNTELGDYPAIVNHPFSSSLMDFVVMVAFEELEIELNCTRNTKVKFKILFFFFQIFRFAAGGRALGWSLQHQSSRLPTSHRPQCRAGRLGPLDRRDLL